MSNGSNASNGANDTTSTDGDVVVTPGSPLVFEPGNPTTGVSNSITVEPGGQIIVQENVGINSQELTVQE